MDSDWGEVVTRYPYRKVRMDHLLSKEYNNIAILLMFKKSNRTAVDKTEEGGDDVKSSCPL